MLGEASVASAESDDLLAGVALGDLKRLLPLGGGAVGRWGQWGGEAVGRRGG